jgi:RNA polymerase sigma factor (sigma-70 family)
MPDAQDMDLVREFAHSNSEAAFTELVRRHINLVYSVARRCTGNDGNAHDVTQAVFIILARKAAGLREKTLLTGWLYETTRFAAARLLRTNARRHARENEAYMQSTLNESNDAASPNHKNIWTQLAPHLEAAMDKLAARDRALLVLRFYENKSGPEAAALLGIREDAAHKRVARALEKLRKIFAQRGVTLTATAIAGAVSANSVHAAPAGLVSTLAATACAAGANSFSLSTLIQTLLMKKTTYAVLAAALTAVITISIVNGHANGPSDAPVTEASLQSGLVLHYTFDNAPLAGKVADVSGTGNDGSVIGAQWKLDPQRGGVMQFSPPDQYIRVPNNDSLNPSNLTLAAWIKTSNQGDTWRRVFDKSFTNGFSLSIGGGHGGGNTLQGKAVVEIGMAINNKKGFVRSDQTVTDGEWHHLVVTYNGTEQILYVDGVRQQRVAHWRGRVPTNSYDLTIGMNLVDPNPGYNEVGASFDGLIDEPMIYNRALSPDEIKFLFESQRK